jgi:protein CpxP
MNKLRFFQFTTLLLLLANLFLLWLHFSGKKHRHEGPRNEIIQRLDFDQAQVSRYDTLIAQHRARLSALDIKLQSQRKTLYGTVGSGANIDSLLPALHQTQREIEQLHYDHFQDIRALCKPDQIPLFEQLTSDLASMFGPGKRGPGRLKP